ncbi:PQQ-binding-like beta-propeller repeat protein [Schlesneria sp. DSM 10557]|uniref:outer membrane protein assembly factor BamB family protein n=1 Tax=Schlesneria sp. DSM 10557 TaxID=3044399 RepID=UPI0035A18A99
MRRLITAGVMATAGLMACLSGLANEPQSKAGQETFQFAKDDWPWWRGPHRNGEAAADQSPPLIWSDTKNVVWKVEIPGKGHGSPILVGDRVFLLTAEHDSEYQSVLCHDRKSGKQLWKTELHQGGLNLKGNTKSTLANSTMACDGERVFATFLHDGAIYASALDLEGKQLWQTKITDYILHQGFGSSPTVYGPLLIVSADNKGSGAIAGLDRKTGEIVWKQGRPKLPNYTSPIILHVAGKDQLIFSGCNLVTSFEPLTGEKLWEIKGSTEECVTSTVTDGQLIYTSGGYPRNHLSAIRADGSGETAWENGSRVYVPSILHKDGYLYAVLDAGVAICWKSDTGEEKWKQRIEGTFSASPVLVGDKIFATNETGTTYIFKATPEGFEDLGENKLEDEAFATPTICGDRIYFRVASLKQGHRQELLYCLGEDK